MTTARRQENRVTLLWKIVNNMYPPSTWPTKSNAWANPSQMDERNSVTRIGFVQLPFKGSFWQNAKIPPNTACEKYPRRQRKKLWAEAPGEWLFE
jgi:hypothetical protein